MLTEIAIILVRLSEFFLVLHFDFLYDIRDIECPIKLHLKLLVPYKFALHFTKFAL
jgi:hypothetical protein